MAGDGDEDIVPHRPKVDASPQIVLHLSLPLAAELGRLHLVGSKADLVLNTDGAGQLPGQFRPIALEWPPRLTWIKGRMPRGICHFVDPDIQPLFDVGLSYLLRAYTERKRTNGEMS